MIVAGPAGLPYGGLAYVRSADNIPRFFNGAEWNDYYGHVAFQRSLAITTTTSPTFIVKATLVSPILLGLYDLYWEAVMTGDPTVNQTYGVFRCLNVDDNIDVGDRRRNIYTDTSRRIYMQGTGSIVFDDASKTFEAQFRTIAPFGTQVGLQDVRMWLLRRAA